MPDLSQIKRQRILDFPARIMGRGDPAHDNHAGTEDLFKRSAGLSFTEKRARAAYPRLAEDGLTLVSIDDNGQGAGPFPRGRDRARSLRHTVHDGGKAERAGAPINPPCDMAMRCGGGAMRTVRTPGVQP